MKQRLNKQLAASAAAAILIASSAANAATITMTGSDSFGTSSFNSGSKWTGGAAPTAGNDYVTGAFTLRTPATITASHTFAGDSLTISSGGNLSFKGTLTSGATTITVGTLILDGGTAVTQVNTGEHHLAGGLSSTSNGGTLNSQDRSLYVDSLVSGSGALSITDSNGSTNGSNTVFFTNGGNTYNGTLTVASGSSFNLASTGLLNFTIGASGVNNSVLGAGTASFNGTFAFDLSGAAGSGSWTIVDTSTLTESFAATFNVAGWTDNADNTWSLSNYTFSELTGVLTATAIPESSTSAVLMGGLILGVVGMVRRRRD